MHRNGKLRALVESLVGETDITLWAVEALRVQENPQHRQECEEDVSGG